MSRLNAVIVNYKTPELVLKCVQSIVLEGVAEAADIIVVDNASPDDSAERLRKELPPDVQFIPSTANGGFSAGINLGVRQARHEYLLVLNPDTYFIDQSFTRAVALLDEDPGIGIVGLDLIYPSGQRQYSARRFYSLVDIFGRRSLLGRFGFVQNSVRDHMMIDAWATDRSFDAEWVMGTGFVIRTQLFREIGWMDESYFLYMEDVDLCARVWAAGKRVVCLPGARLVHDHQRASSGNPFGRSARMHLKSLRTFMRRYRVPLLDKPGVMGLFKR